VNDPSRALANAAPAPPPVADPEQDFGLRRDLDPHRGPLILVLGIVSLVMLGFLPPAGIPFGIAAWLMGRNDLKKIRARTMDPEGESKTNAGRLCGLVGTIISSVLTLFLCGFYALLFGMVISFGPGPGPRATPVPPPVTSPPPTGKEDAEKPTRPPEPDLEKPESVPPGP
jgi:hypothetical protein